MSTDESQTQGDESAVTTEGEGEQPDPIKNIKAEFNRKLSSLDERFSQTSEQLQQMMQLLQQQKPTGTSEPTKSAKDLLYDDPDRFVAEVEQRAVSKAQEKVQREMQATQAAQNAVLEMQSRYPEFAQPGSEATQLAMEKAKSLPAHLRNTPEGARLVLMEAASELGLVPASKRKAQQTQNDEPVASSRSSSSSSGAARKSQQKPKVSDKTLAVAQLLGIDITDEKRLQGLEKAATREKWTKYQ
jgi:hypothetical protein